MTNLSQKEKDKQQLKSTKTFEKRVALLREIGPRHGVTITLLKRDPKDQLKSTFTRDCIKHGREEVKMQAFMRGNFGCPHCARELQSAMFAQLRS
ncbi:hypothetical protein VPHK404_0010 [Vibrio phage K404]